MSRIKARVMSGQNATPGQAAGYQPVTGGQASPPAPMVMPLSRVTVSAAQGQYVTVGQEDLTPIWATDGAPIPAAAPGTWGQLRAAGRP